MEEFMKKPLIGISTGFYTVESGKFAGMKRAYVNKDYVDAVEKAGGVPVLLPCVTDRESLERYGLLCDGFVFSGGIDIHPCFYGQSPHPALERVDTLWDEANLNLIRLVLQTDKPVLAICRGHQLLNVACGGTLYQDVSEMPVRVICHNQPASREERIHQVQIEPDSVLGKLWGTSLWVNSYHHQTIRELGQDLKVIATAKDGVVEAVQLQGKSFVVGIQWHPEMLLTASDDMLPLFQKFIEFA